MTRDVDLVVEISASQVERLAELFKGPDFYCPPVEVMRIEVGRAVNGHFNIIQSSTALKVDVYPLGRASFERNAFTRRQRLRFGDQEVWVAPPDYVITRKLEYYREGGSDKHIRDIEAMLANSNEQLDRDRLAESLAALGLVELWYDVSGRDSD
jgi:hypothetical protein